MPPSLALLVWFILLVALWRYDRDPKTSSALWAPLIWMFILGSQLPSQWLGSQGRQLTESLEEGNPFDRIIFSVLILIAIGILMSRSFNWGEFATRNLALMAFLSFALVSVLWSDYPFVAFKRWFRDLGSYLMILVALSDPRPLEAVRTLLRRLCFLLIPLSVLLIKYYPGMSRRYDPWSGMAHFTGATTSKNMLGVLCLVSGIFFFWDTLRLWSNRREPRTRQILLVNVAFIAMTLWLLRMSASATASLGLALGCVVIAAAHSKTAKQHPALLKMLIPAGISLYLILAFGFRIDLMAALAEVVGRNPTLTGRTDIWDVLLSMDINPLVGTGYESFWLGPRLQLVWDAARVGTINEAHNGFLEVYLNLGVIGLLLLGGFLIASYRTICRRLGTLSSFGSLNLGFWVAFLFHNMTEASFRNGLMLFTFLLVAVSFPAPAGNRELVAAVDNGDPTEGFSGFPLETTDGLQ